MNMHRSVIVGEDRHAKPTNAQTVGMAQDIT